MVRWWTTRSSILGAIVAVAAAGLSCGGVPPADSVAGVSAVPPAASESGADVSSSSNGNKVLICHKGKDKWIPSSAVSGHLRHGDSLDSCPAPVVCPCFSRADIQTAGSQCAFPLNADCGTGDPHYLGMYCSPGGPDVFLGAYSSQTAEGGMCRRDDPNGSIFEQVGLSAAEYQACVNAINDSGFCS